MKLRVGEYKYERRGCKHRHNLSITSCKRAAAMQYASAPYKLTIFVFICQVAPVPACWLFNTPATSWPLTFWHWKWCTSHVWRGLALCQF